MGKQIASIWVVILKLGPKMLSLLAKFGKFVSVGKVGLGAASIAGYAMIFTWQFALVLVGSILFHEYGHLWAMKKSGIKTRGIYLIPFVGGAAVAEESFKTRGNEAFIGLLGPVFGLGLAIITLIAYFITKNPFLAAIAGWMGLINIFNLLPVNPLDGGRIIKSVAFSISSKLGLIVLAIGLVIGAYMAARLKIYIFSLLFVIALLELYGEYWDYLKSKYLKMLSEALGIEDNTQPAMPSMRFWGGSIAILSYMALIVFLFAVIIVTSHVPGSRVALDVLIDSATSSSATTNETTPAWKSILIFLGVLFLIILLIRWFVVRINMLSGLFKEMRNFDKLAKEHPELMKAIGNVVKLTRDKNRTSEEFDTAIDALQNFCRENGYNFEDINFQVAEFVGKDNWEKVTFKLNKVAL